MADNYEKFMRNVKIRLLSYGLEASLIDNVSNAVAIELHNYTLSEISTDLIVSNDSNISVLQLFIGSLLSEGKSRKTAYTYQRVIQRFLDDVQKPIREISTFDIRVWLSIKQNEVLLRTCENYRAYLSSFFMWCLNEDIIDKNPLSKIKPIKYTEAIKKPFSEVEIDRLRANCSTLRERAEFEVLISSGVRVSELCELTVSDIDFGTLEIQVRHGKGNKSRNTFMTDVAKVHLLNYMKENGITDGYIFMSRLGIPCGKSTIENDLKKLGERAKVDNVHPHRCRRTFATNLAKRGMDINSIQILMGHTDINTTRGYIALNDDYVRNQYNRFV